MIPSYSFYQHLRRFTRFSTRLLSSKVPKDPISLEKPHCTVRNIDKETILHLERLSLVDFGDKKCVKILEEAIQLAEQLSSVDTEGIEPLISVLEERSLKKILELADTHGFFSPVKMMGQDFVNRFRLGPTGELLAQNIQKEWIYSCVSSGLPDTVFQHHSPSSDLPTAQRLKNAFVSSRNLMNGKVPFALVEARGVQEVHEETDDVMPTTRHPLHYLAFVNQRSGQQFFYRWQQHRHMWWRKFSMDPGRFSLVENKGCSVSQVDIRVKFPWGDFTVETIKNHGFDFFGSVENGDKNGFEVFDIRKRGLPYVVESICTLEAAMLCYLCDGFSSSGKSQFTLHRRLAPYKVAIAASAEPTTATDERQQSAADELEELASYLSKQLNRAGVCSLPPDLRRPLDTQLARYNALAVPYVLLLSTSTLSTSIAVLRSQLTSAKEEISLSNLISYMEQLTKKV